jgi:hypothetical protein
MATHSMVFASTLENHQVDCIWGQWGQDALPLMVLQHDLNLGEFLAQPRRQLRYAILCRAGKCQFHLLLPDAAPFCHCVVNLPQVGNNGKRILLKILPCIGQYNLVPGRRAQAFP